MKTKLRNTWGSKLMALCLAVVMMLSMSMTVFAAVDPEQTDITVNGIESDNGAQVTAYKLIDVNFDVDNQQLKEPVFSWVEPVATWVRNNYQAYIGTGTDNTVQSDYMKLNAADLQTFLNALQASGNLGTPVGSTTISNQAATFEDVDMGQYLILTTKTAGEGEEPYIYNPLVANVYPTETEGEWTLSDVEVSLKGSTPGIDKDVAETDDGSYAIGDTVNYVITADVPSYPDNATNKVFTVGDKLSSGLSLDTTSIVVKVGETTLTVVNGDYTLNTTATDDYTFLITFDYDKVVEASNGATQVTVTYSATVNQNAFTEDALGNTAFVGFANDPFDSNSSDTETTEKEVYTYGFVINKKADNTDGKALNAKFSVFESDSTDTDRAAVGFVMVENGVYRPFITGEDTGTPVTELETYNGILEIQGIDLDTYYLKEVATEAGYVLPENDFIVELTDDNNDGYIDQTGTSISGVEINGHATANIINYTNFTLPDKATFEIYNIPSDDAGFQLPTTGGMGTMIFTIAGILLMGGAVALIVVAARKKRG